MPELPEVTTIVSQLQKEIVGSEIQDVQSIDGYKTTPEFSQFRKKAIGQKVVGVRRMAKNIVVELQSSQGHPLRDSRGGLVEFIVIHLAMTGRLLLRPTGRKEDPLRQQSEASPWTRLIFYLSNSHTPVMLNSFQHPAHEIPKQVRDDTASMKELRFCDARMFGFVRLMNRVELDEYSAKYGPDALEENLTSEVFLTQLKKKKTVIKRAMLSQEIIAGAGNIYVNDSLWMAGIHPQTMSTQVTSTQAEKLLSALQQILQEGIEHGGSTLGDKMYVDVYGQEGTHQNYFRVFGKDGQPCPRCGDIINCIEIGGRQTYFCPACQAKSETKVIRAKRSENQLNLL